MTYKLKSIFALLIIMLTVSACGIRGALYLPGEKADKEDAENKK
jgi:predicted small lipoprotein YifL